MHVIGSDIDGVIADIDAAMLREAKLLGLAPEDATYDCSCGRIEDHFGWTDTQFSMILSPRMFRRAEPIMPVVEALRRWMARGTPVLFVTARYDRLQDVTREYLDELHLLAPSLGCVHRRSVEKVEVAQERGLTIFLDDYHRVIRPMLGVVPHPFLLASEWNLNADNDLRVWRWHEAEAEIERLLSEDDAVEAIGEVV